MIEVTYEVYLAEGISSLLLYVLCQSGRMGKRLQHRPNRKCRCIMSLPAHIQATGDASWDYCIPSNSLGCFVGLVLPPEYCFVH